MDKKAKYYIDPKGDFVIEDYNLAGSFSNFLPGIAGLFGIPMWAFYVNRGQCVCSFGVKSKDAPIMEFLPANRAYQLTSSQGFRTFIKVKDKKREIFYEPFKSHVEDGMGITQRMFINSHALKLVETAPRIGLETTVKYFTIPNEPFAALARVVTFRNTTQRDLKVDILDGTPLIIPYGVSNFFLQQMRRTIEAWMRAELVAKNAMFSRLKVDPRDVSEVSLIDEGNFYLSAVANEDKMENPSVVVDPELIFGQVNDFSYPVLFAKDSRFSVPRVQMGQNKLPCAMSFTSLRLKKRESAMLYSLMGHISSKGKLKSMIPRLTKAQFFSDKEKLNEDIVKKLQDTMFTVSGEKRYDLYCGQTYLDNVLRGGYPVSLGEDSHVFYAYSRKHGDLERDYNRFYIEPTYFSQGNGNFRDINQNRRNDVFFNPGIKDSNILHFYNLIQADGFNPLVLQGIRFVLKDNNSLRKDLNDKAASSLIKQLEGLLKDSFTPGELFMKMEEAGIKIKVSWHEFLNIVVRNSLVMYNAEHVEGFWIDHWTYNLDLLENYLSVYPEKLKEILMDKKECTFYDNAFCVKPRSERYLLNGGDKVRQYHSLMRDTKKERLIKKREKDNHLLRTRKGEGVVYKTTLLVKLLCLTANKLSSLDPFGIGIEMEADR